MFKRGKYTPPDANLMKKLILLALLATAPASAAEIRSTIVDSVQLTVDAPALQSTRIGSEYSVSGTNISVTTLGGLTGSSSTAPATINAGSYSINTDGQAFTFTEASNVGDTVVTSQSALGTDGQVETPNIYGLTVQNQGGTAGNLAGTISGTTVPTVTAGGAGTTAIGQRSVDLSVFR
jgi:hypothetical protein